MIISAAFDLHERHGVPLSDIAIISPYRKQVGKITEILKKKLHIRDIHDFSNPLLVKVSTVEAFQGRESRVVLLSCVRNHRLDNVQTDQKFSIGFLKQPLRANVALSRAKSLLVIVGNAALMSHCCDTWCRYLQRILALPSACMWDTATGQALQSIPLMDTVMLQTAQRVVELDAITSAQEERSFERVVA